MPKTTTTTVSKKNRNMRRSNRFLWCPLWNMGLYCISDRRSTWIGC